MSFITKFFKSVSNLFFVNIANLNSSKGTEEDYETILSNLQLDIQKRQVKLSEIRLRERRATLLVTLYTLAAWGLYISLWYLGVLPHSSGQRRGGVEKVVKGAPVIIGPILWVYFHDISSCVEEGQVYCSLEELYKFGTSEKAMQKVSSLHVFTTFAHRRVERTLQQLMKQLRLKVEEIKKKTNYYMTRELLQRFDDAPSLRQRIVPAPAQPSTPQPSSQASNGNSMTPTPNHLQLQPASTSSSASCRVSPI